VKDVKPGKDSKNRMANLRDRRRAAGFTEILLWVHPEDVPAVRKYAHKKLSDRDPVGMFSGITKK